MNETNFKTLAAIQESKWESLSPIERSIRNTWSIVRSLTAAIKTLQEAKSEYIPQYVLRREAEKNEEWLNELLHKYTKGGTEL